jgi:azurin
VSDSGLGFSHNRFIALIVSIAFLVVLFEGASELGGGMIKAQVEQTTSKFHPEKNAEDRLKPAMVLATEATIDNSVEETSEAVAAEWSAEGSCQQVIEGNDMLQFNLKEMVVSANCKEVTVTLEHTGAMPANVMGHNWVLTNNTDFMPVAQAGGAAGIENNYVPVGDQRVLAATTIIGGGQETSVTFSIDSLVVGDDYTFFCSFPGHYAIMKGAFKVI